MTAHIFRAVLVAAASFLTYKILGFVFDLAKHYFKRHDNINIYRGGENTSYLHNQNKIEDDEDKMDEENKL